MKELSFLGNGAAFNFNSGNTSACFIENGSLYVIDCGEKIMDKMLSVNLFENVKRIYVFITHLHSDHIGSLEPLLYYFRYIRQIPVDVFYNRPGNLHRLLVLTGIDFDFEVQKVPKQVENYRIETVPQKHIPGSYGFFFFGKRKFFYSGDTCEVNKKAIAYLNDGRIDRVYHEVTLSDSPIHTHLSKLEGAFPPSVRNKVTLMHFSSVKTMDVCKEKGFCVAEEVK